jgi:hypothetical protein
MHAPALVQTLRAYFLRHRDNFVWSIKFPEIRRKTPSRWDETPLLIWPTRKGTIKPNNLESAAMAMAATCLVAAVSTLRRVVFILAVGLCLAGYAASETGQTTKGGSTMALTITSSAFSHNGEIPKRYTCDGDDVSPDLAWSGVPEGTKSLVLIGDGFV